MDREVAIESAVESSNRTGESATEDREISAKYGRVLRGNLTHLFDVEQKQRWDGVRFGHLEHTLLGSLSECLGEDELKWPDYEKTFQSSKGYSLLYKKVDVEHEAERAAEIFQRAIDEMIGNSHYQWHHNPEEIRQRVRSGDCAIYGTYDDGLLISVCSLEFIRGHRSAHWMWGAVIPEHRGKGVWENIGVYIDKVIELSGAHFGLVWMVTTHVLSQRMAEKAGWRPVGVFPGSVLLGGSDGKYYRACVIWYAKLFGDGVKYLQAKEDMFLTPMTDKVARGILDDGAWTVR